VFLTTNVGGKNIFSIAGFEDYNRERKAKVWILIEILDRFKSEEIIMPSHI
jgi:hypothetical protein